MGLSYALEATSFTFITLMVARLGTSVMAGHQIVANLAALCFMVPLSLAVATATLTAHAIGAEDSGRAHRTAATGIRIALLAGASLAVAVWTLRHPIVRTYTSDAAVAAVALTLIPYLAAFHVFDALQTAVGFVLRAHKRAVAPTVVYALALWGVGLFGGYQVAFRDVWGAAARRHRHVADAVGRARPGRRAAARVLRLADAAERRAARVREEHDGR
jgi:MATE family, multidrug efflux pump